MTPIPWPTLTAEEKAKTFNQYLKLEPAGTLTDGVEYVYPPLTLDALFAILEQKKLGYGVGPNHHWNAEEKEYSIRKVKCDIHPDSYRKVDFTGEADNAVDAIAIAILRHAGFEVLTEGKV